MSPRNEAKLPSPLSPGSTMEDGKSQKAKLKKDVGKSANYRIRGRTFACDGCKNGHRVSKCTHALQRPLHMTKDPGRPSSDQKRHCDCPKSCSCTKRNCKCDRNCTCTQIMYMLVYVPVEERRVDEADEPDTWRIQKEVITDLRGKILTADEIEARAEAKANQQHIKSSRINSTAESNSNLVTTDEQPAASPPATISSQLRHDDSPIPSGCCQHRKNIAQRKSIAPRVGHLESASPPRKRPRCNCGPGCSCAFCLDHPNNRTSQRIAQERADQFSLGKKNPNRLPPATEMITAVTDQLSCMGTNPQFAWHSTPNPSMSELELLFGQDSMTNRGYCLSYPVRGHHPSFDYDDSGLPQTLSEQAPGLDQLTLLSPTTLHEPLSETYSFSASQPERPLTETYITGRDIPEQIFPSPSFDNMFGLPNHSVGQATIAGIYGMSNEGANPNSISSLEQPNSTWQLGGLNADMSLYGADLSVAQPLFLPAHRESIVGISGDNEAQQRAYVTGHHGLVSGTSWETFDVTHTTTVAAAVPLNGNMDTSTPFNRSTYSLPSDDKLDTHRPNNADFKTFISPGRRHNDQGSHSRPELASMYHNGYITG